MPLTHPPLMRLLRTRALLDSRFLGVLSALLPGGSLLGWAHFIEPNMVEITHHRAPLGGAKPLRILHLSDLHFTRDIPWAHRVLKKVAEVPCDVMVITGDVIHVGVKPKEVEALLAQLPEPPLGRYACIGNWDRWGGMEDEAFAAMMERVGIRLLVDEAVTLSHGGREVNLVGVDDLLSGDPRLGFMDDLLEVEGTVVLSHTPTLFPALAAKGADLVLSGHTHGGQIRAPFKGAVWMPVGSGKFDAGWFEAGSARLFVSRGIGTSVAPLRFLCRPELALIEV